MVRLDEQDKSAIWFRTVRLIQTSSCCNLGIPFLAEIASLENLEKGRDMRIGILGSGLMGSKLGTIFARAGHEVVFSYSRSDAKLKKLAREAKGKSSAGTPREATQNTDVVLLAVHWSRVNDVLRQAGDLSGKIIITCSLPMNRDDTELVVAHRSSGAEALAKKIPRARLVSAFNTVPSEVLFGVFAARRKKTRPSLVYCGDDSKARKMAARLIHDAGFDPVDAGPLRIALHGTFCSAGCATCV